MKNKKVIMAIIVLILLGIGGVVFFVLRRQRQNPETKNDSVGKQVSQAVSEAVSGYVKESFPLKQGMQGEYIRQMQSALIRHGFDVGANGADGKFGAKTMNAVWQFFKSSSKNEVTMVDWSKITGGFFNQNQHLLFI